MISAWHLIWIIPLAAAGGFASACFCRVAGDADKRS